VAHRVVDEQRREDEREGEAHDRPHRESGHTGC
jgi:hypothetical protein